MSVEPRWMRNIDGVGRMALNSLFGEQIVGTRVAQVSGQFQYGIVPGTSNAPVQNGSGYITVANSLLIVGTGTDSDGEIMVSNRRPVRYIPGHDTFCYWTADYSEGVIDSFQRVGLFDLPNGFFVGYEDDVFGMTRRNNSEDFFEKIDLEAFKVRNGYDFNPQKGNIYRLNYGYLGYATIIVEVLTPDGSWTELHKISYPNSSDFTHIQQTFIEPSIHVKNSGNTTDVKVSIGSFEAGIIDGNGSSPATRHHSYNATQISYSAGDNLLVLFRNMDEFNSILNKVPTVFGRLNVGIEGNKGAVAYLLFEPTITNTPTWTAIKTGYSTMEYSTDATIDFATGTERLPFPLAKIDSFREKIIESRVDIMPGEVLAVCLTVGTAGSGFAELGLEWEEQF